MDAVRFLRVPLLLAAFTPNAPAQLITPAPACAITTKDATYRTPPLTYPMTSDRYAVQCQLGASGTWITARVPARGMGIDLRQQPRDHDGNLERGLPAVPGRHQCDDQRESGVSVVREPRPD